MKMKLLSQTISKESQDVDFVALFQFEAHKLRVRIRSNSYAFQCHAVIERWNGEKWHEVASIHSGAMHTKAGLCYLPNDGGRDEKHFAADLDHLKHEARLVLA